MSKRYTQARKDFEYLETICPVGDICHCFMDEVVNLLRNPNKKYAAELYYDGIQRWFTEAELNRSPNSSINLNNPKVKIIQERWLNDNN